MRTLFLSRLTPEENAANPRRAESLRRLQIGLLGIMAVLLLIALAGALMRNRGEGSPALPEAAGAAQTAEPLPSGDAPSLNDGEASTGPTTAVEPGATATPAPAAAPANRPR